MTNVTSDTTTMTTTKSEFYMISSSVSSTPRLADTSMKQKRSSITSSLIETYSIRTSTVTSTTTVQNTKEFEVIPKGLVASLVSAKFAASSTKGPAIIRWK